MVKKKSASSLDIVAPLSGTLVSLDHSVDPVFAQRMAGDGIAIEPLDAVVVAPCSGTVSQLHAAHHATAVKTDQGVEILIHVGVDTVQLKGQGFKALVQRGQRVERGQPLLEFDRDIVDRKAKSLQTAVLVTAGTLVPHDDTEKKLTGGCTVIFSVDSSSTGGSGTDVVEPSARALTAEVVVLNAIGIHARPAAHIVQICKKYHVHVVLTHRDNGHSCPANSLTAIMELQTTRGSHVQLAATGDDARAVLDELVAAFRSGLGEEVGEMEEDASHFAEEPPLLASPSAEPGVFVGIKAAAGSAVGHLHNYKRVLPEYPEEGAGCDEERGQLDYALHASYKELEELAHNLPEEMANFAQIFAAHQLLLEDPLLKNIALEHVEFGKSAMWSWHKSYTTEAKRMRTLGSSLLAARATDVEDVGERVMRHLLGVDTRMNSVPEKTVLLLADITPSEVATLDPGRIVGVCTTGGGATSHAAILAASRGIPYVANLPDELVELSAGSTVLIDANRARLHINPTDAQISDFLQQQQQHEQTQRLAAGECQQPACTADGTAVRVMANIGSVQDARQAVNNGGEGVGLLRSEFLYLNRTNEPSLPEQRDIYRQIYGATPKPYPVTVRTLDVGGDKPLPYLNLPHEDNPFLGERGIRIGIQRPHMLRKQVRALVQASPEGRLRIMLPMITSCEEFRVVKALVAEELQAAGRTDVQLGIMVEVPATALLADRFVEEVDFFSIGTNDLTQYTLAMDRGHPTLASQADSLHPAVLRFIDMVARAANRCGKKVSVCGSMASDTAATAILLGLGITELSVSVPVIPEVKAHIRTLDRVSCVEMAKRALALDSARAVRELSAHQ